jgi:hypothetical protein
MAGVPYCTRVILKTDPEPSQTTGAAAEDKNTAVAKRHITRVLLFRSLTTSPFLHVSLPLPVLTGTKKTHSLDVI